MSAKPLVRHNQEKSALGECLCPKCAPALHAQPEPVLEPALPPPADISQETPARPKRRVEKSVALDGAERIAVGGNPRPDDAEVARLREALRAAEARWLVAYGALHEAITTCRAQERAIASLQQDLRATVEGVYREKMLADEVPRLWIDRPRWAAIVEAQRCAIALVSKMANAGPDWSASIEAERVALVEALASLNAGDHQ